MTFSPLGLTPLIGVFDILKSLEFYRDILGFEIVSSSPEVETAEGRFSHWVWLRFQSAELMLNTQYDSNERPAQSDRIREAIHSDTTLYIGCADIALAYQQLSRRGLKADPPRMAPYGLKIFNVVDPDGYGIVFQEVPKS